MHQRKPILLVDDDENDIFLMQLALKDAQVTAPMVAVRTGQEAIDYLSGEGFYGERSKYPLPRLVLIDLHMPGLDGFEVLEWLQRHPQGPRFFPVVLSASGLECDRERAAALGACDYRVKPNTFDELVQIVREIDLLWLQAAPAPLPEKANGSALASASRTRRMQ